MTAMEVLYGAVLAVVALDRWLYPLYKRWRVRRNHNPISKVSDTLSLKNANGMVDVKLLQQAFETHERMDEKRCDDLKADIKENRKALVEQGSLLAAIEARLSVLESRKR